MILYNAIQDDSPLSADEEDGVMRQLRFPPGISMQAHNLLYYTIILVYSTIIYYTIIYYTII